MDERLAGACHVFFVRSPVAHARIQAIDVSAALAAPGVVAVFTGADLGELPAIKPGPMFNQQMARPILATDKVRYVGDPVAVVVTEQAYQGEDAVELVDVDYDPLPAVIDFGDAVSDKVLLYEEAGTNVAANFGDASQLDEHLFDECEVVTTRTILNQRVAPAPMETRAAAAAWGEDGRLTAWIPNQGAQGTKGGLARLLGLKPEQVRVITPDVGGAFGAKFGADPEHALVAWVARQLGRPARWTETRYENLVAMTHGRAQQQTVTIGGKRDGTVLAYRLEIVQDSGAQVRIGAMLPFLTILMTPGPYAIPQAESVARSVVTNTTPIGAYRGAGRPEASAAIERAMDLFAAEIGVDPAEVRRRNLLPPFTEPHRTKFGALYDTGDYAAALDKVLAAAGYDELRQEQAERRARGDAVAAGHRPGQLRRDHRHGRRRGGAACRRTPPSRCIPDGTATILTGTSPHGQGHATAWAMLASDELGIPVDKITLKWGDTDLIPEGGGTGGSRSLQHGGAAVRQASQELIEVARERAADAARGQPGRPALRRRAQRVRGGRRPGRRGAAGQPGRGGAAARAHRVHRAGRDVPVRVARRRRRGGHRDRQGGAAPDGDRGRRRVRAQPAAGRGPAARRHRPGRGAGVRGGGRLRRRRQPADRELRRLPVPVGHRGAELRAGRHADPDHLQPARRQGHRRGGHDRRDPGRAERGRRRGGPPRRPAHRHARLAAAGLAGNPGSKGGRSRCRSSSPSTASRGPTRSSRGCCSCTTCARSAACGRPTSAATPPRAAPARCC